MHDSRAEPPEHESWLPVEMLFRFDIGDLLIDCAGAVPSDKSLGEVLSRATSVFCSADSAYLATAVASLHGWRLGALRRRRRPETLFHAFALDPAGRAYDFLGAHDLKALRSALGAFAGPLDVDEMLPIAMPADLADCLREISLGLPWMPAASRRSFRELAAALRRYLAMRPAAD